MPASLDNREARRERIPSLLEEQPIKSQSALQDELLKAGIEVNQATLSRDLRDLGVVKSKHGYELPSATSFGDASPHNLRLTLRTWLLSATRAQNLIVLKTPPGGAQPLALAIDNSQLDELLGTIAGDDTVFLACASNDDAESLLEKLQPSQ